MNRIIILILLVLLVPSLAWAQRVNQLPQLEVSSSSDKIAAVVNENIISTADIQDRIKLAIISSGLPDTLPVRQRLLPQILRGLVDEQLQLQEAKRLDVTIPEDDINQALVRIARDNNMQGDIKTFITQRGGSPIALIDQIRAALSWGKVIQRELRPRVEVGDDEVDAAVERLRENVGKEEYLVNEIFLPVDSPKDEDQVNQFAHNLVEQLRGGTNFAAIARQFSQSTSAATGGDIGWILKGQLPLELNKALTLLDVNAVTDPIRSSSGYHILGLREKRTVSVGESKNAILNLQQVFHAFDENETKESVLSEAEVLRSSISSCSSLKPIVSEKFPSWHWQDYGDINLEKSPSWLTDKIRDLSIGGSTPPLATDKGALIFFLCSRKGTDDGINRDAILSSLGTEKLELQARRLLRDLRRDAYIDVRLSAPPS